MGTRCLTVVAEKDGGEEDLVMYRQMDGYPEGHGLELLKRFGNHKICDGFNSQTSEDYANGMSCLAAQIVAHFKTEIGHIYLLPSGTRNSDEEYIYYLYPRPRSEAFNPPSLNNREVTLCLRVTDVYDEKILYDGSIMNAKEGLGL